MVWLTSQSFAVLIVGCLAGALLVAAVSHVAARVLVPEAQRDGAYSVASPLMSPLGAAFAILAALTLASEAGYLTSAQQIVSNEAADASRLAWAATMPGVSRAPIEDALRSYLLATRGHEWKGADAARGDDPATTGAVARLERVVRAEAARSDLGTPTSNELLAAVDGITNDRRARLAAASREPSAFYVITLVVGGVALIANAAALTMRSRFRVALLIGGLTVIVGMSLALIFALGTPWRGPITVSGQPLDTVLRDLATGYFRR